MDERLMGQDRAKMRDGHTSGLNNLLTEDMLRRRDDGTDRRSHRARRWAAATAGVARFRRIFLEAVCEEAAGRIPRGCSGDVPYRRIVGLGVFHGADIDWRDLINDLVS